MFNMILDKIRYKNANNLLCFKVSITILIFFMLTIILKLTLNDVIKINKRKVNRKYAPESPNPPPQKKAPFSRTPTPHHPPS